MADTVTVPGVGPVKKPVLIGGIAILAGILAVAYYRHAKNASAAAASTADAGTTDPSAIDPATGMTYAEEAAGIAAGDLSGYGTGYGDTSGIVGYDAQGNPIYADQVGYGPSPSFTTNGNWAQAAEQYLVSTTGADAGTVAAALGTYIQGQPLTSAQASIVNQAVTFFGQPPQSGSNGYPPLLKMVSPPGGTGTGTPAPKTAPPGFSATPHEGYADFGWGAVTGALDYELAVTGASGKGAGTSHVDRSVRAPATHAEKVALAAGRYTARVRARNGSGQGPWAAARTITVTGHQLSGGNPPHVGNA